jgi:hypothetical protein
MVFPFQMELRCEELLHEVGVRAKLSCIHSPGHCIMRAVDRHPMQVMWDEIGVTFILLTIASCVHIDRHPMQVMWDEIGEAEDDRLGPLPQRVPDQGRAGPTPPGTAQVGHC